MEHVELSMGHPTTGSPCQCSVWIVSRHATQGGAEVTWHAKVREQGQAEREFGLRHTELMEGALLLPPEVLAKSLLTQSLAS
ncbi:hypothetical protein [Inhella sp.]|uniref:hypothetical protein n=1 Tax=Inhella sp. TaxID=1921806 RepID=UPI0035AFF77D